MAHDPRLLDFLESLPSERFEGVVFRYTAGHRAPDHENTLGARWNPPAAPAIYAALDRETAIAEFHHHLSIWSPRPSRIIFTMYELRVTVSGILDLRPSDRLHATGLSLDLVGDDDFSSCQVVGGAARWLRSGGLLVPSARSTSGSNLVVFPDIESIDIEILSRAPLIP
jgi:RES domain-containing protein